ncbi:AtpZ/AtpI family protein [Sphingopyxis sp. DBS4]|uniref:AtpZ/AtpI family protein n=1 Tax=Sphingopyxis sp. DBS4 TaxID=2968500 RepID=UPI00214B7369|nr:AtpZ/AtpI family protein [Sphingopyxis sp. DBS4]
MTENGSDPEHTSEDSRLVSLEQRLDRAEAAEAKRSGVNPPEADANYRLGNRVLAELLGGLLGGALIGWLIDRFADTSPWGLLGMLALGIIVAFRNIFRIANAASRGKSGSE